MLKLTQTGVADIGYVAPAYTSDKMPVSEVAMLPGAFDHSCQGTLAYWKLARNGVIAQQDYAANNIHLLLAVSLPQYRIFTVKQPVKDVGDVTGLKLRSTGGAQDLTLRAIGAVPVRMAAPDAYESLSRGTMDGLLFPLESVVAYGADKLVKYSTDGLGFGSFIVSYSISDNVWKKLSPEIQKAMIDVAEEMHARRVPAGAEGRQRDQEIARSRRHPFRNPAARRQCEVQGSDEGRRQGVVGGARRPRQARQRCAEGIRRGGGGHSSQINRKMRISRSLQDRHLGEVNFA